ncbi:uncharacterized protein UTRI_10597 [Ustilago trichophora]|uniref:LysM domain-containing protein n=1 Tax=Ustilago trichophora TaxID=86804 RepID=A0A5C3EBC4_9BASI|nr:uncharacterized protein UTRI_10597 [Ustilago trichophora]
MRLLSTLLPAALLPFVARAAFHSNNTACTRHYTVQPGDTCDKIGQKTLTSTYQILAFNLLDAGADCYTLEIGSELCLGRYGNDCQFVHQCTEQDTCESIASNYGITTQRLQSNNPSLDCNIVYDGLMLCVSAGSIRPPADKSINATDVKVAREQARQAWLLQERAKKPETKSKDTSKAKKLHPHSSSTKHPQHKQHHTHPQTSKHAHSSGKGGKKSSTKSDLHQDVIESDAKLPSPKAEPAPSNPSERHDHAQAPQQQQQQQHTTFHEEHHYEEHHHEEHHTSSHHQEHHSSLSSSQVEMEQNFIDEILSSSSTPLGSNHTPHHAEQQQNPSLPPLAGATNSPQRRHRSLSSRSHHQRSHTP